MQNIFCRKSLPVGFCEKNKFTEESDLDFLVNFSSDLDLINYANNYFNFLPELQQLFDRKIA